MTIALRPADWPSTDDWFGDELPPHVKRDRSAHRDRIRCPRARRADSLLLAVAVGQRSRSGRPMQWPVD
jgi:hypothetical protein